MANSYSTPDHFAHKAKQEGYAARSVYKLQEIDYKYHLFRDKQVVLDLGAAPGSWSQYALKKIGEKGTLVGIDLKASSLGSHKNYHFIRGDITKHRNDLLAWKPFDIVMSDMAPDTTGIKSQDVFLSHELSFLALDIAKSSLKETGKFLCKIFEGEDIQDFYTEIKSTFKRFKSLKPAAVRKNSKEIYVIAWDMKNVPHNPPSEHRGESSAP